MGNDVQTKRAFLVIGGTEIPKTIPAMMGIELIPVLCKTPTEISSQEKSYLEELLTCPICFELSPPPIFQCNQGHTICAVCHPKLRGICALCRGTVTNNLRNRGLETLYNNTTFNCGYKSDGCMQVLRGDQFEDHMNVCEFQRVKCRFANDRMQCTDDKISIPRPLQGMISHLLEDHGVPVYTSGEYCSHDEILELREDVDIPLAFWKFNEIMFLEQIKIRENIVHLCITQLPQKVDAEEKTKTENYFVEMQLIRKGFDCAPNIRKGIFPMTICPFGKNMEDYAVVYSEQDFKTTVTKCDPNLSYGKFCWISRMDFKWIGVQSVDTKFMDNDNNFIKNQTAYL